MRDPDVITRFTDHRLGVEFEHVRTAADVRAEFPWMPETRWGAWPVDGNKLRMSVGATSEEALRKLYAAHPELRIAA